jgi:hypothetical protein
MVIATAFKSEESCVVGRVGRQAAKYLICLCVYLYIAYKNTHSKKVIVTALAA